MEQGHDREDLWNEIAGTKSDVSKLNSNVANLDARMIGVEGSLNRIEAMLSRPKNIPWVGIATLVISVVIGAVTYIQARLAPIEDDLKQQREFDATAFASMVELAEAKGKSISDRAHNSQRIDDLENALHEVVRDASGTAILANSNLSRLNEAIFDMNEHHGLANHPFGVLGEVKELSGLFKQLSEQVQRIDSEGSRVWKNVTPNQPEIP